MAQPLWFTVLMAILVVMITIFLISLWITNSKIKKGAGYKGSHSGGKACNETPTT